MVFPIVREITQTGPKETRISYPDRITAHILLSRQRRQPTVEDPNLLEFGQRVTAYADGGQIVFERLVVSGVPPLLSRSHRYLELGPSREDVNEAIEMAQAALAALEK